MLEVDIYEKVVDCPMKYSRQAYSEYGHLINWKQVATSKIIDVGCGEGTSTVELLQEVVGLHTKNYEITAIDSDLNMIRRAKEKFSNNKFVEFEVMDIACTKIPQYFKENFDVVNSTLCLHWVTDDRWAQNCYDMLKPNGQVFLVSLLTNPILDAILTLKKSNKYLKYYENNDYLETPFFLTVNPESWLRPLLERVNFKNIIIKVEIHESLFQTNHLKLFIKSFTGIFTPLPDTLKEEFVNDTFAYMFKNNPEYVKSSEECLVPVPTVLIIAEK